MHSYVPGVCPGSRSPVPELVRFRLNQAWPSRPNSPDPSSTRPAGSGAGWFSQPQLTPS